MVVLLVLAIIATIVMVFTDNPVWMRIGTLAALWAAFIGAFLVARYRRRAASEAARVRDLATVYELQLEREISARREHELVVEKDLRDTVRAETSDSILALRHEIAALREQLGQLGVTLPEDRFAVAGGASAGELGAAQSLPSVQSERVEPRRRGPASTAPGTTVAAGSPGTAAAEGAGTGAAGAGAGAAGVGSVGTVGSESAGTGPTTGADVPAPAAATGVRRESTPSTERTEKFSPVDEQADPADEQMRRPAVRPAGRARPAEPTPAAPAEPMPAAPAEPTPAAPASAEDEDQVNRHGQSGGLSVSDLMARLGTEGPSGGGRRRRRAED